MSQIYSSTEFKQYQHRLQRAIKEGALFIYPTDTIYGIGCDARQDDAIQKIFDIKESKGKRQLPVIAPSKDWIRKHCIINTVAEDWLKKLPGPYLLILALKKDSRYYNSKFFQDTIGIRIPNHWISEFANYFEIPLITTSANKTGEYFMRNIDDLNHDIKMACKFIVYDGEIQGRPSTIVNLAKETPVIRER